MAKKEPIQVDSIAVPEEGQRCSGCGGVFRKGEWAHSLFFAVGKAKCKAPVKGIGVRIKEKKK